MADLQDIKRRLLEGSGPDHDLASELTQAVFGPRCRWAVSVGGHYHDVGEILTWKTGSGLALAFAREKGWRLSLTSNGYARVFDIACATGERSTDTITHRDGDNARAAWAAIVEALGHV